MKKTKIITCENELQQSKLVEGDEVDQLDTLNFPGLMIVKGGGSTVDLRMRLAMVKNFIEISPGNNNNKYV